MENRAGGKSKAGWKPSLSPTDVVTLRAIIEGIPRASLDELTRELHWRGGVAVCSATVRKALRTEGIQRVRPERVAPAPGEKPARYGDTKTHRRQDVADGMNTDLTDAAWALLHDLFERKGVRRDRAPPCQPQHRHLVQRSADSLARTRDHRLCRPPKALGRRAEPCLE